MLDGQVLVADHAAGTEELAAGHEAVWLVEGELTLDAVEQLCTPGHRVVAQADARAPGAVVQRADEPPPLLMQISQALSYSYGAKVAQVQRYTVASWFAGYGYTLQGIVSSSIV